MALFASLYPSLHLLCFTLHYSLWAKILTMVLKTRPDQPVEPTGRTNHGTGPNQEQTAWTIGLTIRTSGLAGFSRTEWVIFFLLQHTKNPPVPSFFPSKHQGLGPPASTLLQHLASACSLHLKIHVFFYPSCSLDSNPRHEDVKCNQPLG